MTSFIYPGPGDTTYVLEDGGGNVTATLRTGRVGGVAKSYDFGAGVRWDGFLVVDVATLDTASGDENYLIKMELCANTGFADGERVDIIAFSPLATGQLTFPLTNNHMSTNYRYGRIRFYPSGTTPVLNTKVWMLPQAAVDDLTLANLTKLMGVVYANHQSATDMFRAWAGGVVDGGPNSDGDYPLYDAAGAQWLVPCPAKLAATAGSAGLELATVKALDEVTTPIDDVGEDDEADQGPLVPGVFDPDEIAEALKSFRLFMFAARRTQDLLPFTELLNNELIPGIRMDEMGNVTHGRIELKEIVRNAIGVFLPHLPPYNVKFNGGYNRQSFSMEVGSNVVVSTEPVFHSSHVGMHIQIGGADRVYSTAQPWAPGGTYLSMPLQGYIGVVTNAYQCTVVTEQFGSTPKNCTVEVENQDGAWGFLATAAMQDCLNDLCPDGLGNFQYGGVMMMPQGLALTGCLKYLRRTARFGHGTRHTSLVRWYDCVNRTADYAEHYSLYADGTPYYSAFPEKPHATWSGRFDYRPSMAPLMANEVGFKKDRTQGSLVAYDSSTNADYGTFSDVDFPADGDYSINGARYCQGSASDCFEFRGGLGAGGQDVYYQVDPYPMMSRMHMYDALRYGMAHRFRHSGTIMAVECIDNASGGFYCAGFDINAINLLCIGSGGPGLIMDASSANGNWINIKVSYNGANGGTDLYNSANMVVQGHGHNFENVRVQESRGPSLLVLGYSNTFTGMNLDDTGCIVPAHTDFSVLLGGYGYSFAEPEMGDLWTNHRENPDNLALIADYLADGLASVGEYPALSAPLPDIMPAILFYGVNASYNRMNDIGMGGQVHVGQNYATHAVFFMNAGGMPHDNTGRIFTKDIDIDTGWYDGPGSSGDYAPGPVGFDATLPTTNRMTLDDIDIHTL